MVYDRLGARRNGRFRLPFHLFLLYIIENLSV
jgi:hypothetical protein